MGNLWQDIRFSLRALRRSPAFTFVAVLALGLGIGASTAIFTVMYGLIWRPLPGVAQAGDLVSLTLSEGQGYPYGLSLPSYNDYRTLTSVFSQTVGFYLDFVQMNAGGTPERLLPMMVTGNYFDALGVKALHGRTFNSDEANKPGSGNVIVLSDAYWQERFGGRESAIGSVVHLNDAAFTIIGVAPPEFHSTSGLLSPSLYIPLTGVDFLVPGQLQNLQKRTRTGPFAMIARLQPGVTLDQARAAASTLAARLEQEYPATQKGQHAVVVPEPRARMEAAAVQYMPPIVTVFMTLVALLLLVVCANVANLLLARASSRHKELTIRAALGAGRLRILRQSLVESTILALLGGGAGLLFALWPIQAIGSIRPATDLPISFDFTMDYRVFAFTMVLAAGAGLISGLLPGLRIVRADLAGSLKEGGRVSQQDSSRQGFRDVLVASQVAVCLILLVAAGLFFRSTINASQQDFGFDIHNRLVVGMDTQLRHDDEARSRSFYRQLLDRVRSLPGVSSATLSAFLPIGFGNGARQVYVEGAAQDPNRPAPFTLYNVVETDYFRTMGMPILQGRDFTINDTAESPRVAIINQEMASKFWPGQDPIGRRFRTSADGPAIEVIGLTRVVKFVMPAENPTAGFYLPFSQNYQSGMVLTVHSQGDPMKLAQPVRGELKSLDPEMPVFDVRSMETHILRGKMILFNIATDIMAGFGLIGMALAAVGLYGLMAFIVNQRSHEIGVRMALGASRGGILRMIVGEAMKKAGAGIVFGLIGAYGVTRLLANYLVGVTPTDLLTFAVVTIFLALVVAAASLVPAFRATQVDPMAALRGE